MTTVLDMTLDFAFEGVGRVIEAPYVAFLKLRYRVSRSLGQSIPATLAKLDHPQWLAEFMLAAPLLLLGILIQMGVTGAILSRVMPLRLWAGWLFISGGANLLALLSGSRGARFWCSATFLPGTYLYLLLAFGALSFTPRRDAAFFGGLSRGVHHYSLHIAKQECPTMNHKSLDT